MSKSNTSPSKNPSSSNIAIIGLVIGCMLFGMGSLIVAHLNLGGFAMSFWRLSVAGIIFIILAKAFKQDFPTSRRAIFWGLLSGLFLGLDLALWHESIYAVGPGISTLLNSLQIFFLAGIGYVLFQEKQTLMQLLSLGIAITGVAMIGSPEFTHNSNAIWGFVSGIVSGAMLATSMTCIRKNHEIQHTKIFPLMTLISIGGSSSMFIPMLILDAGKIMPTSVNDILWILVYGGVMQCMAWGLIAYSIPKLSLSVTGLLLLSEPIVALFIDYFWLEKSINTFQWFGAFLTMMAIYLGSVKSRN